MSAQVPAVRQRTKPPAPPYPQTPETARAWFAREGLSIAEWARAKNLPRGLVYDALRGRVAGRYGQSHKVYVALGLKPCPSKAAR